MMSGAMCSRAVGHVRRPDPRNEPRGLVAAAGVRFDDLSPTWLPMPENVTQQLLKSMDHADRERLSRVRRGRKDSAGADGAIYISAPMPPSRSCCASADARQLPDRADPVHRRCAQHTWAPLPLTRC
jgi:hypothetical protein